MTNGVSHGVVHLFFDFFLRKFYLIIITLSSLLSNFFTFFYLIIIILPYHHYYQTNFTLSSLLLNSRIKCLSILRTGSSYCYAQRWTALSQAFTSHQQPSEYLNCLNQKIFPSQLSAKLNKLFQLLLFYFLVSLIYAKFISGSNILALYKYFVHNTALIKNKH